MAAVLEIAAMMAILFSYIWSWQGSFRGSWLLVMVLYFGLAAFSEARRHERHGLLRLDLRNVLVALRNVALVVVPACAVVMIIGAVEGSWHFRSWEHFVKDFPWLVVWAVAQQYGLLCFFYRGFQEILENTQAATAVSAVTFAAFHAPNAFLMAVTFCAGIAAIMLYRRSPNVFVIGLGHAALSYVLYCALPFSLTHGLRVGPGYYSAVR